MSTEHQRYSTENQGDAILEYAARRGLEVVRTYADEGKSGLRLDGRDALKRLIEDVQTGKADFTTILVYDVSRWGRFQDADESAYYEYICRRAGIAVQYCAEQFENDGSPVSTIVKGVKRAMQASTAGSYRQRFLPGSDGAGQGLQSAGFGNLLSDWAIEAGLPTRYNTHGLRKTGATRVAEAGWTDHEIAAWGGWKSLSEVQRYTRTVNRRKLAQGAVHKLTPRTTSGKPK